MNKVTVNRYSHACQNGITSISKTPVCTKANTRIERSCLQLRIGGYGTMMIRIVTFHINDIAIAVIDNRVL